MEEFLLFISLVGRENVPRKNYASKEQESVGMKKVLKEESLFFPLFLLILPSAPQKSLSEETHSLSIMSSQQNIFSNSNEAKN